jgi:DDE_Tnp_1-associated
MDEGDLGRSLLDAFATIPDPRIAKGRRHTLPAILALATTAMLSGARSLYAIWQWGRLQDAATLRALGFTRQRTPAVSTLHLVFRRIDVAAFEAALQAWAQQSLGGQGAAIAIDGKGLRGIHGEELPGVRLVAAYADDASLVLAQKGGKDRGAGSGAGARA